MRLASCAWKATALPDRVPPHYDWSGHVHRCGTKTEHLALMAVLGLLVIGCFAVLPRRLATMPAGPNRCTTGERRAESPRNTGPSCSGLGQPTCTTSARPRWPC